MAAKKKRKETTETREAILPEEPPVIETEILPEPQPIVPEPLALIPEPVAPVVQAPTPVRERKNYITFSQWAKNKGIPPRHFAGMRAFLPNPDRSFTSDVWDDIFSKY